MNLIEQLGGYDRAKEIITKPPKFIVDEICQEETMYCPRTNKYVVRGPQSVLIQLESSSDDYYHSTMPYSSSFYSECIYLKDIKSELLEYRREHRVFEVMDWVILPYDNDFEALQIIISINDKHGIYEYSNGCCGYGKNIRHATPEEIKAGRRL